MKQKTEIPKKKLADGLPQPFKKLAVHFETPMLDRILKQVEGKNGQK